MALLKDRDLQRVDGVARVAMTGSQSRNALTDLRQHSPCKVMFPLTDGQPFREAVFLNTAGGVAGGDRLRYEAAVEGEAALTLTTQAAERVYRALDTAATIHTRIDVRDRAALHWLPQETILFDGGKLNRNTEIHAEHGACALAMETLVFGRAASGEKIRRGEIRDQWRVHLGGRLVWTDVLRLKGDLASLLDGAPLLAGAAAISTLIYVGADAEARLDQVRVLLTNLRCTAGATLVNKVLICRFAASRASDLREAVGHFLAGFRGGLPRVWTS